jgi:hypothetical protein
MDLAFRQAIERGEAAWALAVSVPPAARLAPVRGAFARLAARTLPEARVTETEEGLIVWDRGEGEPAAAGRLAARFAELLPEAPGAVCRCRLPEDAGPLAAALRAPAAWPFTGAGAAADPGNEALHALGRTLAALPPEAWVRRSPVVSLRHGAKARPVAHRLGVDAAVAAKALRSSTPLPADQLRPLEPLLLAALPRLIGGEAAEGRLLLLPLCPEAALGGAYDRLEQAIGRGSLARIVPAIALADAAAAPRAMASARARLAADGQRLLLGCDDATCLGLLASLASDGDILALPAAAAQAAGGEALRGLGPQRLLLGGCRAEADIAFGLGLGIGLFEGPVVEALLGRGG